MINIMPIGQHYATFTIQNKRVNEKRQVEIQSDRFKRMLCSKERQAMISKGNTKTNIRCNIERYQDHYDNIDKPKPNLIMFYWRSWVWSWLSYKKAFAAMVVSGSKRYTVSIPTLVSRTKEIHLKPVSFASTGWITRNAGKMMNGKEVLVKCKGSFLCCNPECPLLKRKRATPVKR
jgi:hypothetical protein